ncbi:MAG: prenyltransferase [Candidatus Bathyarchaeia archaeon]
MIEVRFGVRWLRIWLIEVRAPFFIAVIIPVLVGATIAWSEGLFEPFLFSLTLASMILLNAGTNVLNDYFDYVSGIDLMTIKTPFSGGSGLLPRGILEPKSVYKAGLSFLITATLIGIYLATLRGYVILILGLIGVFTAYFYSTQLAKRGVGELLVGINLGPLAVLGSYYVQVQRLALEPFVASLPIGLLIAGVLYINEFPDFDADKGADRYNLVVRLGRRRAADGYVLLMSSVYACIMIGVLLSILPLASMISLVTFPYALWASKTVRKCRGLDVPISVNRATIVIHVMAGITLTISYILDTLLS